MDVDFDSPVNVERPPPPLTFNPDSHEPALPSSPPPPTMSLPPLDPTNHQHNSQQLLSRPSLQLQPVQQFEEASVPPTTTTDTTTTPDQPPLSNDIGPIPQLDGVSAEEAAPAAEAPADDSAMDTSPDNDTTSNRPNDTPNVANPDPSQQTSTSDSQPPPPATDDPTSNTTASHNRGSVPETVSAPVDLEQPSTGSEAPPPPQPDSWNQNQAVATNADVDEDDQDDSSSEVSDDQGRDEQQEEHVYWADIEEDTSSPNEEELKEMTENAERGYNAVEYDYWEKSFYPEVDDPEYQPLEKARVTWKFKGVRGTKENPNRAYIMRSPPAYIGGYYWSLKFFPRGNSVSALSVYVVCSRTPPPPVPELSELEFKVLKGAPDAVLSDLTPDIHIVPTTEDSNSQQSETKQPEAESKDQSKQEENDSSSKGPVAESAEKATAEETENEENWRVPAQIGVVVYNPNEPRTSWMQSSCHQFNPYNDDWGWTNFHGPWDQIHKRQRGQRQALLRNDTLAFDAYIKIYDDPTKSLWWHPSDSEPAWNSYAMTGYAPIGDPDMNHRHEVAALISWCHLAPFREVIQNIDVFANLSDSNIRPRPLSFSMKKLLSWLQKERRDTGSVNPELVIRALHNQNELSGNVTDFWERLRRSLEIELADTDVPEQLSKIFDCQKVITEPENSAVNYLPSDPIPLIRIPAKNAGSVQSAVSKYLQKESGKWSLPEVLNVELDRQEFDKGRWTANLEKVTLDQELALDGSVVDGQHGKYTLYGFVVHNGKRTWGRFYSILRPSGPGGRWLAFNDGRPSEVECLTTKGALEGHCGLDMTKAQDVNDFLSYDVAAIVMYIRSDVVKNYLGLELAPVDLPSYRVYTHTHDVTSMMGPAEDIPRSEDLKANVSVEVYSSSGLDPLDSRFDAYDLMSCARSNGSVRSLTVPARTTYNDLREKLALWESPDNRDKIQRIRFWHLCRSPNQGWLYEDTLVGISDLYNPMSIIFPGDTIRLWMDVVSEDDAHLFSVPNTKMSSVVFERAPEEAPTQPEPTEVAETGAEGEANGEQANTGNTETVPPERSETPRASDNVPRPAADGDFPMGDGDEDQTVTQESENMETEPAHNEGEAQTAEPAATTSAPEEQQDINGDVPMEDATENDAAIAAVIASDLEEFENSQAQAMEAEPTPPPPEIPVIPVPEPLSVSQSNEVAPQSHPEESVPDAPAEQENATVNPDNVADQNSNLVQGSQHADVDVDEANRHSSTQDAANPPGPPKPDLPVPHVYYFLQFFDTDKQELRFIGRYFTKADDNLKETLCRVLGWPEDKDFSAWIRFPNAVRGVDLSLQIGKAARDQEGCCFVVGEKLSKEESSKIEEAGSFACPRALLNYLWALSRRHPTDAFTGTKVIDDPTSGDRYSGELTKGYYHGKGTHISDAGIVYTGDFILGGRQGQGLMEYPSGDTYDGGWHDDQRHGQGTFIERRTGNKYVGGYRDGKRYGKGISYWEVADEEMDLCQICYSEDQDALFYDCGHVCACVTCAKQVDICPMCRKNVISVVRIYKT